MTNITNENIFKIFTSNEKTSFKNFLNKKNTKTPPIFVIKYGPPASGKGHEKVRNIIKNQGHDLDSYININIDDVIESHLTNFSQKSKKLINNILDNKKKHINDMTNKNYNEKFTKQFSVLYFEERKKEYMHENETLSRKLDRIMVQSINNNKNIIFETTGGFGTFEWMFNGSGGKFWETSVNKKQLKTYKIIVIFPIVSKNIMWDRYKKRAINSYKSGKGFRFTSTKLNLFDQYDRSYNNFLSLIQSKTIQEYVNEIYLVNNDEISSSNSKYNIFKRKISNISSDFKEKENTKTNTKTNKNVTLYTKNVI